MAKFEDLKGKIIREVVVARNEVDETDNIIFFISKDEIYKMFHEQDCCESVIIEDISGDIEWLEDSPILIAEERTSEDFRDKEDEYDDESRTWTFYELATLKGAVTIRWYGTSNGYYSERVDFERI